MKYYTMCYPGELGQLVQETFSEYQILQSYFDHWYTQMRKVGKLDEININTCIEDWVICHWAWETDQQGNKVTAIADEDFQEFDIERAKARLRDLNSSDC